MFNPAQVSAQLTRMSDMQLQSFAQMHKTDPYIVALALSESNRRQQVRATATQMPQEQPTVVDQDIANITPQTTQMPESTGIAQLPAQNMQTMKDGGIVGYAEGDVVQGSVYANTNPLRWLPGMNVVSDEGIERGKKYLGWLAGQNSILEPTVSPGERHRAETEAEYAKAAPSPYTYQPTGAIYGPPAPVADTSKKTPTIDQGLGATKAARSFSMPGGSYDPYAETEKFVGKYYPDADKPKATDFATEAEAFRQRFKEAGGDPDVYKKGITAIAAQKDAAEKDRDWQTNMRLIEIGLGIAGGTSQYALENIGKGAMPGIKGMAEDLKEFRKNERELNKAENEFRIAQNQFATAQTQHAEARVDKAQDRLDTYINNRAQLGGKIGGAYIEANSREKVAGMQMQRWAESDNRAERGERAKYFQQVAHSADAEIKDIQSNPANLVDPSKKVRLAALIKQRDEAMATWSSILGINTPQQASGTGANVIDFSSLPSRR